MDHVFEDPSLLEEALTHTSFAYENGGAHNERLEFLGDAVLQVCATHVLFERFPMDREGTLSRYRARLVSTGHLASLARRWKLDEQVRLGKGEEQSGGRTKERLLAGVFEAVLGAIYLDSGPDAALRAVSNALEPDIDALPLIADARKSLHEWCQRTHGEPPQYRIAVESGPPHDRTFDVEAMCNGQVVGSGRGKSKRTASIAAAESAMVRMSTE